MPKQEVGSTKWLGNKMKAKGLQKLRWYCQMCQKQCRDENGFKCHRMSDGHQRQMQVFVQDPNKFMDEFSEEFETGFMHLMSHRYRSTRILANTVYCEHISERHHTHMNSTIWVTLSNFVQYLGRTNQCTIDKTPKGWYLQYVDNSPETLLRKQQEGEHEEREVADEERERLRLARQVEDAKADGGFQKSDYTELQREEGDAPITFTMGGGSRSREASAGPSFEGASMRAPVDARSRESSTGAGSAASRESSRGADGRPGASSRNSSRGAEERSAPSKNILADAFDAHKPSVGGQSREKAGRKLSVAEEIMLEHEASKKQKLSGAPFGLGASSSSASRMPKLEIDEPDDTGSGSAPTWVAAGLIVKVMHSELANGKYYRKKGTIEKVKERYAAHVRMAESKDLIKVEQELLETVIPQVGRSVVVVKGGFRGRKGELKAVDFENFSVTVKLSDGTVMEGLGYEEICKFEEVG